MSPLVDEIKQYRLAARCPKCAKPVRIRNSEKAIQLLKIALDSGVPRSTVIQTYQCARQLPSGFLCNTIVEIRLGDWIPTDYP